MADGQDEDLNKRCDDRNSNLVFIEVPTKSPKERSGANSRPPVQMPETLKLYENVNIVRFDRKELNQILRVYGFRVASGEWRDYAIDMLKGRAVFSVFRRTSEVPLYMIEKNPKLARRQGAYSVVNGSGHVLKRGHDLAQVLRFFDRKPKLAAV